MNVACCPWCGERQDEELLELALREGHCPYCGKPMNHSCACGYTPYIPAEDADSTGPN